LLLSGFYTTDNELLESKAENLGLVFDKKMEKDGWSLLSYQV
jgi:ribosomal protein L11 methylase PrmA